MGDQELTNEGGEGTCCMSNVTLNRETEVQVAPAGPVEASNRLSVIVLIAASMVSNTGNAITGLAIPWFVLETTGSAARTGLAGAMTAFAIVVSGALAGPAVDRMGYKHASVISDLLSGITVALVPTLYFMDMLQFWHLLVLIFAGAIFDEPGWSARTAMVPRIAREADMSLERLNAAIQFATQGSNMLLGPLLAGFLVAAIGATGALYVDAGTFAVSMVLIGVFLRYSNRRSDAREDEGDASSGSYLDQIVEGIRFTANDKLLRVLIPFSILYNFTFSPIAVVILPVFAQDVFDSARALGLMLTGFGAGTIIGTIAYGARGEKIAPIAAFIGFAAVIAMGFWLLVFSSSLWLAIAATTLTGTALGPVNILSISLMQRRVPEGMMGRVFGMFGAFSQGAAPVGVLSGGFLVEAYGYRSGLIAIAILATFGLFFIVTNRGLRQVLDDVSAEAAS